MSLAEHIDAAFAPPEAEGDEGQQRFVIDGPKTAEWALRKLARLRGQMVANADLANEERRRITEWLEGENAKLQRDASFFEGLLTEYHRHVLEAEPDRKTIALPAGKLVARKQPDRWDFSDDFIGWAVSHRRDLVRVRYEVEKPYAKKELGRAGDAIVDLSTGETVPGVKVEPGDVRFSVEVAP